MKIKTIITGASGMVGEGVLHECLQRNDVERVLVIGRRSCGHTHPKLIEIVHRDLYDLSPIEDQLKGYNACFFCLGMSSVGVKEPEFTKVTYDLTMHFANTLSGLNPDMTFCYVSGRGTNENGKQMWQRVKGKTETDLTKLPFKQVYNFRPGVMKPTKGLKHTLALYKWMGWLLPIINTLSPKSILTLKQVGDAMINVVLKGYDKKILEVREISALSLANKYQDWFAKNDDYKPTDKLELAKYLWDEYKYRHEHCWNLTFKFTISVVTLGIIPYIKSEKFSIPYLMILLIPPLLSIALSFLSRKQLKSELEILDHIRNLYRPLQDKITIPFHVRRSTFTKFILGYFLSLIIAAILNSILIVIWKLDLFKYLN